MRRTKKKRTLQQYITRAKTDVIGSVDWAIGGTGGFVVFEHYGLLAGFLASGMIHFMVILLVTAIFVEAET